MVAGLIALGVVVAAAPSARCAPDGVSAVTPTPGGVHFSVRVSEPRLVAAGGFQRLEIDGYDPSTPPGAPSMPARQVLVAVPLVGSVRVSAAAAGWRRQVVPRLAPTPWRVDRDATAPDTVLTASRAAYAKPAGSATPARLVGVEWVRNQRVATIVIEPARWDPATGQLDVATEVTIDVSVAGAAPAAPAPAAPAPAGPATAAFDPFEKVYEHLLVNYEQGRAWRRTDSPRSLAPLLGGAGRNAAAAAAIETTGVFAGKLWVKIAIPQTGFYKITFARLRNTAMFGGRTDVPNSSLRLYTWPGVPVMPENSFCDSCDYHEVSIGVVDANADGLFSDNADYFYFYGLGPNGWTNEYDPTQPDTVYLDHPYETNNFYFLTLSDSAGTPARIVAQSAAPGSGGGAITPVTFRERLHFEVDAEYFPDATPLYPSPTRPSSYFWEKWFWRSIDPGRSFGDVFDAPGADLSAAARLRIRLWGLSARDTCTDDPLRPDHLADFEWQGSVIRRFGWQALMGFTIDTTLTGLLATGNDMRVGVPAFGACPTRTDRVGFAWYDVFYRRRFEPVKSELTFESPDSAGDYLFRTAPFDTIPRVFDITDANHPAELVNLELGGPVGGPTTVAFEVPQAGRHRYAMIPDTPSRFAQVPVANIADAPPTSLNNLRSADRDADYLVIYYDAFRTAAQELAAWRHDHNGFTTDIIPVSALYDQFSGGRLDPAAIRNFLRATRRNLGSRPAYVTLLGDASFDFKNITGRAPTGQPGTLIPSYENGFDTVVGRQFASDDWMLNVDSTGSVVPDFFGGRIPADDAATALDVVRNKVIFYEKDAPLGEYRNRIMLIADDNFQGPVPDGLDFLHLQQTSDLDDGFTPPHLDRVYVYLHTYPTEAGSTKPAAKDDIKLNLNRGVAIFNYIGHGSPFKLSDESVLLDTDVGTLANPTTLPVFIAASCDIGKFNDPQVQSLGEKLLMTPGRGAVAIVSATELALSTQNAKLNQTLYATMFSRGADGRYFATVSEALLSAKGGGLNSLKYELIGDAATRPNLPQLWTDLALYDSAGVTPVTTLDRGRTLTFRGRVLDRPGGTPVPIDGVASMLIEDSAPRLSTPPCSFCSYHPLFYFKAGPVFRGDVAMHGGAFEGRFVVPLEAATGARARVRSYVRTTDGAPIDGVGNLRLQLNPGTAGAADHDGPRVTLSFPSGASAVRPDAVLRIDLSDPSGILITGHTPQNGIIVTLDGNTTGRIDVTSSFRYAADSYQSGSASYTLKNLSVGAHTIEVSAADNLAAGLGAAAHRSSATIAFDVVEQPKLSVSTAYLFPNPTSSVGPRGGGRFVIDSPGDSVNVLIKLYTVAGRLIRSLRVFGGLGQTQVPWDGLDDEGAVLANGVYLFKVYVNARTPDGTSSALEKAHAVGRFVIVNR